MGKRDPMARALSSRLYRHQVVESKKTYNRKAQTTLIAGEHEDGEVLGWSSNRHARTSEPYLLCWDAELKQAYCCGETLLEFGEHNLSIVERQRLGL